MPGDVRSSQKPALHLYNRSFELKTVEWINLCHKDINSEVPAGSKNLHFFFSKTTEFFFSKTTEDVV